MLVQTPVYNCFFSSIRNNGCEIVESPLQRSADTYVINFDDLEQKLSDPAVKLFILCNPHNPAGRVWTPDELRRMNDLCLRHNVRVVSDEIHCELTMPGYTYTPFASVSDECLNNSVTLNSPSKSFNTAGLQAFFSEHLPQLAVTKLEGTYLVWVDISSTGLDADTLTDRLLHEAKVMVNSGTMYGREAGKQFIRINIACPKARLMEALKRIKLEIDNL